MFQHLSRRPGRCPIPRVGAVLGGLCLALAAPAQEAPRWTLSEAMESAFDNHPTLRARRAAQREAVGRLATAETYPYNPALELELADRSSSGGSTTDRGLSLSQEIELGGQRRQRIAVAREELSSAEETLLRDRQLMVHAVETAFAEAVRARELLAVAETDAALAREILDFSRRRLERGATTQIEVNLALASAGRAERSIQQARASYASARGRLAEAAGVSPALPPEPLGELLLPEAEPLRLEDLLELAVESRGDLRAAERQELAAEASIRLALAERRPNLLVGAFFQREEASDDIVGATVGISLPLFDRNQGQIAESRAARERLGHQKEALRLGIEREVATAWSRLQAARAAAEHLRDQVLGTLDESVELLQRSFLAGRIGATEVVTLRREFVASRRETVEALAEAWLARVELDLAVGRLSPSGPSAGKERS